MRGGPGVGIGKSDESDLPTNTRLPATEPERVATFRVRCLLELGFTLEQARLLMYRADVAHDAADLLARNWPREFIVDKLSNP